MTTAAAPGASEAPRSVAESNEELKKMRGSAKGTLHFVALVLANKFGNQVAEIVDIATWPFCEFFDLGKTVCKTVMGSQHWHEDLAMYGFSKIIRAALTRLEDPFVLQPIGFTPAFRYKELDEIGLQHEESLAQTLFNLVMAESYTFLLSSMTRSDIAPGKFLGLLSDDSCTRVACLKELQAWWELLQRCEQAVVVIVVVVVVQ
jgi:hypothetical protein